MTNIDSFSEKLQNLITKFEKDKAHYLSKGYLEAQLKTGLRGHRSLILLF